MNQIKILHTADIQYKSRKINLIAESEETSRHIENQLIATKADVYVIAGDLTEYCSPNEVERTLIYSHISRCLLIPSLKEIVIIDGNHDVDKQALNKKETPTSVFREIADRLVNTTKLLYITETGYHKSKNLELQYLASTWTDTRFMPSKSDAANVDLSIPCVTLFHHMLRDYAIDKNLPLTSEHLKRLPLLHDLVLLQDNIVMAGDIHEPLDYVKEYDEGTVKFYYPSSPMQHTFGEGSYLDCTTKKVRAAHQRRLLFHTFNGTQHSVQDLPHKSSTDYWTIKAEHAELTFDAVTEIIAEKIEQRSGQFFKLSLHPNLQKYESDFNKFIISEYGSKHVEFEYPKVAMATNDSASEAVREIVEEKQKEIEEKTPQQTDSGNTAFDAAGYADNLVLSDEQLLKLFKSITKDIPEAYTKDCSGTELSHDIATLFSGELAAVMEQGGTKRRNIELVSVWTNGFMAWGENTVNLDIHGLTRLLADNGTGKTTLFYLLYWIAKGVPFMDMPSNQPVKNTLPVFSNRFMDKNFVQGKWILKVNGRTIEAERTATRIWKRGVSDEQMYSKDWTDYISKVERTFTLTLHEHGEKPRQVFEGDSASDTFTALFGSALDNIIFIDYTKLDSRLRMSPQKLSESVMEYIGADYVSKLEERLPSVKERIVDVATPKLSHDAILQNIQSTKDAHTKLVQDLDQKNVHLSNAEKLLQNSEMELHKITDAIIELGNIPEQLKKANTDSAAAKEKIAKLEQVKQPVKPEQQVSERTAKLESCSKLLEESTQLRDNAETAMAEMSAAFDISKNENISAAHKESNDAKEKLDNAHTGCANVWSEVYTKLNTTVSKLQELCNSEDRAIQTLMQENNTVLNSISVIESSIKSGVCSECKKAYSENWEQEKEAFVERAKTLQQTVDTNKLSIDSHTKTANNYNAAIQKYSGFVKQSLNKDITLFDNLGAAIEQYRPLLQQINTFTENIAALRAEKDAADRKVMEIATSSINGNAEYAALKTKFNEYAAKCKTLSAELEQYKTEISDLNTKYTNDLEQYSKTAADLNTAKNMLANADRDIASLLPKNQTYEILADQKQKVSETVATNKETLKKLQQEISECDQKIYAAKEDNRKAIDAHKEYSEYRRKNAVWQIYSNAIKTSFKKVVFDYYRTFLNTVLDELLCGVYFRLYWNSDNELIMINNKKGRKSWQPAKQSSGMERCFLGLALVYTEHLLNVSSKISHIFIDELSGPLSNGKHIENGIDYRQVYVELLHKFTDKKLFVIDHVIEDMYETAIYTLKDGDSGTEFNLSM